MPPRWRRRTEGDNGAVVARGDGTAAITTRRTRRCRTTGNANNPAGEAETADDSELVSPCVRPGAGGASRGSHRASGAVPIPWDRRRDDGVRVDSEMAQPPDGETFIRDLSERDFTRLLRIIAAVWPTEQAKRLIDGLVAMRAREGQRIATKLQTASVKTLDATRETKWQVGACRVRGPMAGGVATVTPLSNTKWDSDPDL
jgi:hypothetical protein